MIDDRDLEVTAPWDRAAEQDGADNPVGVKVLQFVHADGTTERSIFIDQGDNMSAQTARELGRLILEAADRLDRLDGGAQ